MGEMSAELQNGEFIVSTTAFLRRNNGHSVLPETRPYRFNERVTAGVRERDSGGSAIQDTLRRIFILGFTGNARAAVTLSGEAASRQAVCELERAWSFWLGVSEDYERAITVLEGLLQEPRRSTLGEREVLWIRSDIAYWHGESDATVRAQELFEQVANDAASLLGRDDLCTLSARNSVAYCRGRNGDIKKALDEYRVLAEECEDSLGPDSRDTLMVRNNIAYWCGESGDTWGALRLFEQLLGDVESVFGRGDFYTLSARNNVAYWRGFNGDPEGAVVEYKTLLGDAGVALGDDDYHTLSTRLQIGLWNGVKGDLDYAIHSLSELLADVEEESSMSRELEYSVRHQLARWYGVRGDRGKAVEILERLVSDQQRTLGGSDYRTLASRGLLSRHSSRAHRKGSFHVSDRKDSSS
ncbi:MAG: tetratricopeptide repeat protein [Actinoallomurus sp.]